MVDIVKNIITPIIQLVFVGGVGLFIIIVVWRAGSKMWREDLKWIWKYSIRKKKYHPVTIEWIMRAIMSNNGYFEIKRFLMIRGIEQDRINETMWIYLKVLKQLKGGKKNGQGITGSNREVKTPTDLPTDF